MKPKAMLTIAAMLLVFAVPAAMAVTFQYGHQTGGVYLWQDTQNWVGGAVPTAAQQAVIPTGKTVYVQSTTAICGYVDVQGTGQIVIDATSAAAKLTLDGSGTDRTSTLDDGVKIRMIGTNVATLHITNNNHTFTLSGSTEAIIQGEYNTTNILTDSSKTLTIASGVTVQGATTVDGGTFVNNGKVLANDATSAGTQDTLKFDSGTVIGTGTFEVNTTDAFMEFDATGVTATAIWGTCTISAGTLDCETQVAFLKHKSFTMTGGTVFVDPGVFSTVPPGTFEAH